jgi:hypothetical protein
LYSPWGPDYLPGILDLARAFLGPQYVCGDADNSGAINLLDATYLVNYLYKEGPEPEYPGAGDPDASGGTNILDVTYIINYLYKDGPEPLCP